MARARTSKPGNPTTAVAYLRVSTDHQDLGPEAQRHAIEAWAAANGIEIISWHLDKGVSGGSEMEDRPELIAAIGDIKVHGAGVLLVAKHGPWVRGRVGRSLARMLSPPSAAKIFLATEPVDMRRGHDGLCALVRGTFDLDPYSGQVFVFVGKRGDRIKALFWDRGGAVHARGVVRTAAHVIATPDVQCRTGTLVYPLAVRHRPFPHAPERPGPGRARRAFLS